MALLTAIAALAGPAKTNILWLLGQDGASLEFRVLQGEFINVGLDDMPISSQAERVDIAIPYWRAALENRGASPATVRTEFFCTRSVDGELYGSTFQLFDKSTQKRLVDDVEIPAGEVAFVNVTLSQEGPVEHNYRHARTPDTCDFEFSDKYGIQPPAAYKPPSGKLTLFDLGSVNDRRHTDWMTYCPTLMRGIRLGDEPVDCLSATHLFAIETVMLWERALSRALRQAAEFRRVSSGSERIPALILTTCGEDDCKLEEARLEGVLRGFVPAVSLWICEDGITPYDACRRMPGQ